MSAASIAMNRFGYGFSHAVQPGDNPRKMLLRQIEAFDPAPAAIRSRVDTRGKTGEMLQMLRKLRQEMRMTSDPADGGMAAMIERMTPDADGAVGGYRQLSNVWRLKGWWQFVRREQGWGAMTRKGFGGTPA